MGRAKPRILVVEDEPSILMGVCDVLAFKGYAPRGVESGDEGLELALSEAWDLLILDVMLPEIDGVTICRRVREARPRQAILMLTARGDEADVLAGFEAGADDYVTKPFSVAQLLARVAALLRRVNVRPTRRFSVGEVEVDAEELSASIDGRSTGLTPLDVDVLSYFASSTGRVLSRDELLREVWGYKRTAGVETRCVDMQIAKLRRKLGRIHVAPLIQTVRGAGYRFGEPEDD